MRKIEELRRPHGIRGPASGCLRAVWIGAVLFGSWLFCVGALAHWWLADARTPGSSRQAAMAAAGLGVSASGDRRSPDGVLLSGADASAVRQVSAPSAWGGARQGNEPTLAQRVVDYTIHARLDPQAHSIEGQQTLVWRNRSDRPIGSVYLYLYLNAFAGPQSTFMREQSMDEFGFRGDLGSPEGEWGRAELRKVTQAGQAVPWVFVQPDGGALTDRTVVRLDLPTPVSAGGQTTLELSFFSQLPRVVARTGYFGSFHLVAQWFPKMAVLELPGERGATEPRWNVHEFHLHSEFYADFGHFDVTIDVPQGYVVGATGEEVQPKLSRDGRWIYRFVQGDVHDFAWTADHRTAEPLRRVVKLDDGSPVSLTVLYPPEYAANAQPVLQATEDALAYFSRKIGPYPYKTVTAVVPPYNAEEAGGMEYPTFFTASSHLRATPGTLAAYGLDFVSIHEFGHGYFYGILASNEFEEPMLDEGINQFVNLRMIRDRGQRIPLVNDWLKGRGFDLSVGAFEAERFMALSDLSDPLGQNSWLRRSSGSYGTVYRRTATLMRDLEARLGHDTMDRALQLYYQRWKFRHPSVADWQAVLAEVSNQPELVHQAFEQHVYAVSRLDDAIESLHCEQEVSPMAAGPSEKAGAQESAGNPWRTTVLVQRRGAAVPQTLRVRFADGSTETVTWADDSRWKRWTWVKPAKVISAELDPQGLHSLDVSLLDNSRTLAPDRKPAGRLAADLGGFLQALMAAWVTL